MKGLYKVTMHDKTAAHFFRMRRGLMFYLMLVPYGDRILCRHVQKSAFFSFSSALSM